jgi:hypothetical protein
LRKFGDTITITLDHAGDGNGTLWRLTTTTTTRVLYSLVHRATRGRYSSFTIRLSSSKATITDSADISLGVTDLVTGGTIELSRTEAHVRSAYEVHVERWNKDKLVLLLPRGASVLSVISYIHASRTEDMCKISLW